MAVTVQDVIQMITEPAEEGASGVDGIVTGEADARVRGVAVAFVASHDVIVRATQLGANLLITHEGVFYSHHPWESKELLRSPVYSEKMRVIRSAQMNIYRYHDSPHRSDPDLITAGLVRALEWETFVDKHLPTAAIVSLPEGATVRAVADHVKDRLDLPYVRAVGRLDAVCRRIGLAVGYRGGGQHAIPLYEREGLDLMIAGEGPEWETPEYAADAASQGLSRALLLLGHGASEEPGMKLVADRLRSRLPGIPVHFVPGKPLIEVL